MKRFALALFAVALTAAVAQQPQPNPQQQEIAKEAQLLQAQSELLYEKLHGLQEFQDYLRIQQQLAQMQQQYNAAATKPEAPKPPQKPVPQQPSQ